MPGGSRWSPPLLEQLNKASTIPASTSSVGSSIGLDADVVPVRVEGIASSSSPRLSYLRVLSGQMVNAGLAPLEPPPSLLRESVPSLPLAPVSGVLPEPGAGQQAGSAGIIFTLWNTMMGSTLLVMPYTFQQAGWLLAMVLSILCAIISHYTCALILRYAQGMMADPSAEFADLAHAHFGEVGRLLAFLTGNVVVLGAAVAMHGYTATVLA